MLFLNDMEEETINNINRNFHKPKNCPNIIKPEINSKNWNRNF